MPTKFDFTKGIYRVEAYRLYVHAAANDDVNTRVKINGVDMRLTNGKEIPVYDVSFDDNGWAWGDITPEGAQQHHFICLWNVNTVFAKRIGPLMVDEPAASPLVSVLESLAMKLDNLETNVEKIMRKLGI